jgi:3-hydroxypropanoate dehydrogenase
MRARACTAGSAGSRAPHVPRGPVDHTTRGHPRGRQGVLLIVTAVSNAHLPESASLDTLFQSARTCSEWRPEPVAPETLHAVYDLMKWGPTAANSCPLRIVFVTTPDAKALLLPAMSAGNVEKTRTAPVTAILAQDMAFYDTLPQLFPHADARSWYAGREAAIAETAMRNSSLQAGYFILAARAAGLDCGPMSGFDADKVNAAFLGDTTWRVNFLCNLGYGDRAALHPRLPRLAFDEACIIR